MGEFPGSLWVRGDADDRLRIVIDLDEEALEIRSRAGLLGRYSLDDVGIRGEDDGFHLRVEGEEFIFQTELDVEFALAVGLQSASPRLRKRMGAALREPE